MSTDVEVAVAGLTERQVRYFPSVPHEFITWEGIEYIPELSVKVGYDPKWGGHNIYSLTDLGRAVQTFLKKRLDTGSNPA